jgi:hypothetical protein
MLIPGCLVLPLVRPGLEADDGRNLLEACARILQPKQDSMKELQAVEEKNSFYSQENF